LFCEDAGMPRSIVRKRSTQAQREAIVSAYQRSQLTQREFANQAGISVSALQLWLRKAAARPSTQTPAFVEVPNLLAQAPGPAVYRLHLPGAIDLEIGSGFRSDELAALLQLLRSL
jgi:transcriptional regulator with XRE-family HTH domain